MAQLSPNNTEIENVRHLSILFADLPSGIDKVTAFWCFQVLRANDQRLLRVHSPSSLLGLSLRLLGCADLLQMGQLYGLRVGMRTESPDWLDQHVFVQVPG